MRAGGGRSFVGAARAFGGAAAGATTPFITRKAVCFRDACGARLQPVAPEGSADLGGGRVCEGWVGGCQRLYGCGRVVHFFGGWFANDSLMSPRGYAQPWQVKMDRRLSMREPPPLWPCLSACSWEVACLFVRWGGYLIPLCVMEEERGMFEIHTEPPRLCKCVVCLMEEEENPKQLIAREGNREDKRRGVSGEAERELRLFRGGGDTHQGRLEAETEEAGTTRNAERQREIHAERSRIVSRLVST